VKEEVIDHHRRFTPLYSTMLALARLKRVSMQAWLKRFAKKNSSPSRGEDVAQQDNQILLSACITTFLAGN